MLRKSNVLPNLRYHMQCSESKSKYVFLSYKVEVLSYLSGFVVRIDPDHGSVNCEVQCKLEVYGLFLFSMYVGGTSINTLLGSSFACPKFPGACD